MTPNNDPIITITLPLSGINGLLAGAARLPYGEVAGLIHEVQQQTHGQLQQLQAPAEQASAESQG